MKRFKMLSLFCLLGTSMAVPSVLLAGETLDNAPTISATNPNGKKILFDNVHGQTAGAADWVIDGGFSDFAEGLASEGYDVAELRKSSPITYSDLSAYDVFVIPEANIPFKSSEQDALLEYVSNGGSIFFIADHYNADRNKNRWDSSEVFNGYRRGAYDDPTKGMSNAEASSEAMNGVVSSDWLADNFGVRFRYNALGNIDATQIVAADDCFGITDNVDAVAMHAGSTLAILDPNQVKGIVYVPEGLTSSDKWSSSVDEGVYNNGGIAEGPYVAIGKKELGKVAFIGDSSAVEDSTPKYLKEETGKSKTTYDGYSELDDRTLLLQLMDWLATQENYTDFTQTDISLSAETTLHDYEIPSLSEEVTSEPWANPSSSYKWYDSSTFKAGSYYLEEASSTPTETPTPTASPSDETGNIEAQDYVISLPSEIEAGKIYDMTIYFNNLEPNTTLSNLKVGAYMSNGTQIGLFNVNDTWQTSYAYSKTFSVTTDENGHASYTLQFKLKSGQAGEFNMRLKQGSKKLVTISNTVHS